ncbi:hypothetical protein ACFXPS_13040 [Nocardia sp. NPDC059091]|uniref:hypothetical protein n=1 Tax=unclassified Nocardia TaxID=2637762 RepID=UPI0036C0800D
MERYRHGRRADAAQLLTRAASYDPEAPAVVSGTVTLTYRELAEHSNALARKLIEALALASEATLVLAPAGPYAGADLNTAGALI